MNLYESVQLGFSAGFEPLVLCHIFSLSWIFTINTCLAFCFSISVANIDNNFQTSKFFSTFLYILPNLIEEK